MSKKQCMSCEKIVEYSSNKEGGFMGIREGTLDLKINK